MPRRFAPPPVAGRKPQTGATRRERPGPVIGQHLAYLLWLQREGALGRLAEQELAIWRAGLAGDRPGRQGGLVAPLAAWIRRGLAAAFPRLYPAPAAALPALPNPLTGSVRFGTGGIPDFPRRQGGFDPARPPLVAISIHFLGAARELPELGAVPVARSGDTVFAWANLDRVERLASIGATVHVEALRAWLPTSGTTLPAGSGTVQPNGVCLPPTAPAPGPQGAGVRLAAIDLGFDFLHPCFTDAAGGMRVASLLDLTLAPGGKSFVHADLVAALDWYRGPPPPPNSVPPAAVDEHIRRLATFKNNQMRPVVQSHGTRVSGIALGRVAGNPGTAADKSGDPRGVPAAGVAQLAEPMFIAIGGHDETRFADSTDVHAAFQAAFADLSKPCVALMANSDNLGPHDGTLPGEHALDDHLLSPGSAIVLSAGNLNHGASAAPGAWHAQQDAGTGGTAQFTLFYGGGALWPDSAEIWFRVPPNTLGSARVSALLSGPTKVGSKPVTEPAQPGAPATPVTLYNSGTIVEATLQREVFSDALCLRLVFRPPPGLPLISGTWTIEVDAIGMVHGWLDRNNERVGRWMAGGAMGANRTTLGSPAVAIRPLSVASVAVGAGGVVPSTFSGRGPVRETPAGAVPNLKPDFCAVGEMLSAARASVTDRVSRNPTPAAGDYAVDDAGGTSFSAPQGAGACALLFERYGTDPSLGATAATWADLRQGILKATTRRGPGGPLPGMPPPELDGEGKEFPSPAAPGDDGWDPACGHGLLDISALLAEPPPQDADVFIPKAAADQGEEPFVAARFWDSPAIRVEQAPPDGTTDPATAQRLGITVLVRNRGRAVARDVSVAVWHTPLGALHPLPGGPEDGDRFAGAWSAEGLSGPGGLGNRQPLGDIAADGAAEARFAWSAPPGADGRLPAVQILAAASADGDRYDPDQLPCALNNLAFVTLASMPAGTAAPAFTLIGSQDVDGLVVWREEREGRIEIRDIPVTALPWRQASLFPEGSRDRPLYDPASPRSADFIAAAIEGVSLSEPRAIEERTDIRGAERLDVRDGLVRILAAGRRLDIPRLRVAPRARLGFGVQAAGSAALHVLHLSGGRRVGGGSVTFTRG